jgi:plasmid stabilization system protein ParE
VRNCLQLEKNPEDYNEEDLRIIKDYEERVEFRLSEREHYRKKLETEFQKLSQSLKVRKFSHF